MTDKDLILFNKSFSKNGIKKNWYYRKYKQYSHKNYVIAVLTDVLKNKARVDSPSIRFI